MEELINARIYRLLYPKIFWSLRHGERPNTHGLKEMLKKRLLSWIAPSLTQDIAPCISKGHFLELSETMISEASQQFNYFFLLLQITKLCLVKHKCFVLFF